MVPTTKLFRNLSPEIHEKFSACNHCSQAYLNHSERLQAKIKSARLGGNTSTVPANLTYVSTNY